MKKTLICIGLSLLFLLSCQKKQNVLYIFNWTDYISQDLITAFEAKYNCKVVYDTYNSNENMLTKVIHATESYDLVVPSGDHVSIMAKKNLLEEIDRKKLPNYTNLDTTILNKAEEFDPGNKYSIPYFWGTSGLMYNKKYIPEEMMQDVSWNIIADKFFVDKDVITLLDDPREVIGAALIYNGYSVNETGDEALEKARQTIFEWDKNVSQFDSDSAKNEIQDGTTWLAQLYNGDALQIMVENEEIGFALPKEGTSLWIDSFVILKNAENKDMAYKFLDFIMDANNAKDNALYVQYATPNKKAFELLPSEISGNKYIYPPAEFIAKCSSLNDIGENITKFDKLWEEIHTN